MPGEVDFEDSNQFTNRYQINGPERQSIISSMAEFLVKHNLAPDANRANWYLAIGSFAMLALAFAIGSIFIAKKVNPEVNYNLSERTLNSLSPAARERIINGK